MVWLNPRERRRSCRYFQKKRVSHGSAGKGTWKIVAELEIVKDTVVRVQIICNNDKTLYSVKFRWKGSIVNVRYLYENARLTGVDIPKGLNLTHFQILELINQLFIQQVNVANVSPPVPPGTTSGESGFLLNGANPFKLTKMTSILVFNPVYGISLNLQMSSILTLASA